MFMKESISIKKEYDICHYLSVKGLSFNSKSVMCVIVYWWCPWTLSAFTVLIIAVSSELAELHLMRNINASEKKELHKTRKFFITNKNG